MKRPLSHLHVMARAIWLAPLFSLYFPEIWRGESEVSIGRRTSSVAGGAMTNNRHRIAHGEFEVRRPMRI